MYHELKSVIKQKYGQDACNVGDEGGFAPNIQSNLEGIELLMAAIKKAGYEDKVSLARKVRRTRGDGWRMGRPQGTEVQAAMAHTMSQNVAVAKMLTTTRQYTAKNMSSSEDGSNFPENRGTLPLERRCV